MNEAADGVKKLYKRQIFIKERLGEIKKERENLIAEQKSNREIIAKAKPAAAPAAA